VVVISSVVAFFSEGAASLLHDLPVGLLHDSPVYHVIHYFTSRFAGLLVVISSVVAFFSEGTASLSRRLRGHFTTRLTDLLHDVPVFFGLLHELFGDNGNLG